MNPREQINEIHEKVTQMHTIIHGPGGLVQRIDKIESTQSRFARMTGIIGGICLVVGGALKWLFDQK